MTGNSSAFNSRIPFEIIPIGTQAPSYDSRQLSANIGGPLASKKASFFFNIERRDLNQLSVRPPPNVRPPSFAVTPSNAGLSNPPPPTNPSPPPHSPPTRNNTLPAA